MVSRPPDPWDSFLKDLDAAVAETTRLDCIGGFVVAHFVASVAYVHLRPMALDPCDLALSKLERNSQMDRDDVSFLARHVPLDLAVMELRYQTELRWQLARPEREDLTLNLWLAMIREVRERR